MKLPNELLFLLSIIPPAFAVPTGSQTSTLHRRSTTFRSLRGLTHLSNDYSTQEAFSHPTKFFHESTFNPHYDGRFASTELPHHTRLFHLRLMLKAYMDTMDRIGVKSWLMHGCLLGWWWNGRIMPWDTDIDVMVDERGINELGGWWNMSVHHFTAQDFGLVQLDDKAAPESEQAKKKKMKKREGNRISKEMLHREILHTGKRYLLEVNPHYTNTSTRDAENVIDARWIDTSTGLFIDITTVHIQPIPITTLSSSSSATTDDDEDTSNIQLYTKDQHAYTSTQIFPLRTSTFESIPVHIPFSYEALLLDEYGPKALTQRRYKDFWFDEATHEWVGETGFGRWVDEEDEEGVIERLQAAREKMDYLERVGGRQREKQEQEQS